MEDAGRGFAQRGAARPVWLKRVTKGLVLALLAAAAGVTPLGARIAQATLLQSTVVAPIDGTITSNPNEPHHRPYDGDYSFDVGSGGVERPVYARFRNTNGALSLTVVDISRACRSGVFADGGDRIKLNVFIDGAKVGTVVYAHMTSFPYGVGAGVPVGAHIGDLVTGADGVHASSCWTGPHVHVEPRNDRSYGCFVSIPLGTGVNGGTGLGLVGGERASGVNQVCPPGYEDVTPPRPPWASEFVDQSAFRDAALTRPWNLDAAVPGQVGYLQFRVRNIGANTWFPGGANPVRLGTWEPENRASPFATDTWIDAGRPTAVREAAVATNEIATFVFQVRVPVGNISTREHFRVVADGASWMGGVMWRDFQAPACAGQRPTVVGTTGRDRTITGSPGNDVIHGYGGRDSISGGGGDDLICGGSGSDRLRGNAGIDRLYGQGGNDVVAGNAGADILSGGPGRDVLNGGDGNDRMGGGSGADRAGYASSPRGVDVRLSDHAAIGNGADTLRSIERVSGSRFADVLVGNSGANVLRGGRGRDRLSGGSGNDHLVGGPHRDRCNGGAGRDSATSCESRTRIP